MKDKLKKIIAVGGASLMAGSATVPSQAAKNNLSQNNTTKKLLNHIKNNQTHSAITGGLALSNGALILLSAILGHHLISSKNTRNVEGIPAEQMRDFLSDRMEGQQILYLLKLNLTDETAAADIKIDLENPENEKEKLSRNPGTVTLTITEGEDDSGLCAAGSIMHGLHKKNVTLEKLAVILACNAGGKGKLTTADKYKEDDTVFNSLENDPGLNTYQKTYLNEIGTLLEEEIEKYLIDQLRKKYPDTMKNREDEEEKEVNEETQKPIEAKEEKYAELLTLDYTKADSKQTITLHFYTDENCNTEATAEGGKQAADVYMKVAKGNRASSPDQLEDLYKLKGKIDQFVYHIVAMSDNNNNYVSKTTPLPILLNETINGYSEATFTKAGQEAAKKMLQNIETAYGNGHVQTETSL